jgi:hypothetical protein
MLPLEVRFCGLTRIDLALKGNPSPVSIARFGDARRRSMEERRPVVTVLGSPSMRVRTHAQGARGGYRYRCTARRGTETWLFKEPKRDGGWNSRLEFNCEPRNPLNFLNVCQRMERIVRAVGLLPTLIHVSRIDFGIELVLPPGFDPRPAQFSAHSRTEIHRKFSRKKLPHNSEGEISAIWKGRRICVLTIGGLPGREIIISRMQPHRRKNKSNRFAQIAPKAQTYRDELWRVDIRLGKKYLRNTLEFAEFREISTRATGLFGRAIGTVRYLSDRTIGSNISRHPSHPYWEDMQHAILKSLEREKWI